MPTGDARGRPGVTAADAWWPSPDSDEAFRLLDAVVDQSPIGIGLFDLDLRYVRVNPALSTLIGLPQQEIIGHSIEELLSGLGRQAAAHLRHVISTGEPRVNVQLAGTTPGDPTASRFFVGSYARISDRAGRTIGAASFISDVTSSQQAQWAVQRATEQLLLLGRASSVLASTLDLDATLAAVARLVVPDFADHCTVDLMEPDGSLRRMAVVHAPGAEVREEEWTPVGERVPISDSDPVQRALEAGHGLLLDRPEQPGLCTALLIPLVARGATVGVARFGTSLSGRRYGAVDLAIGEQLAARAAVAIDNARMYAREQAVAVTLQRSLLPGRLPVVAELGTAACYLPAPLGTEVGGDWYDVIPLSAGRVGITIGDVMGRGVRAAAVMGQLRAAVRAYAVLDIPPSDVLSHLDELVRELDDVQIVTCVYAVYDPGSRRLCFGNAGHPPPIALTGTTARPLTALSVPLGVGGVPFDETELELRPGEALVLSTDGLVEARGEDIDQGVERLCQALLRAPADLEQLCSHVLHEMGRDVSHDDDIALLAVRARGQLDAGQIEIELPPAHSAVRDARRATREAVGRWQMDELADPAELLVSELVTNAVRHAGGEVMLRVRRADSRLYVEVADGDTRLPRLRRTSEDDEGGRGLFLVDALARRWGSRPIRQGKIVWCELER
jgi:PAS domain S-box-containing protein